MHLKFENHWSGKSSVATSGGPTRQPSYMRRGPSWLMSASEPQDLRSACCRALPFTNENSEIQGCEMRTVRYKDVREFSHKPRKLQERKRNARKSNPPRVPQTYLGLGALPIPLCRSGFPMPVPGRLRALGLETEPLAFPSSQCLKSGHCRLSNVILEILHNYLPPLTCPSSCGFLYLTSRGFLLTAGSKACVIVKVPSPS